MIEKYSLDKENKVWIGKDYSNSITYSHGAEVEQKIFDLAKTVQIFQYYLRSWKAIFLIELACAFCRKKGRIYYAPLPLYLKISIYKSRKPKMKYKKTYNGNRILEDQMPEKHSHLQHLRNQIHQLELKVGEIQDFYNNEYEVLPCIYKRFGHILKVIMGKRTMRSLFNENEKKYKD